MKNLVKKLGLGNLILTGALIISSGHLGEAEFIYETGQTKWAREMTELQNETYQHPSTEKFSFPEVLMSPEEADRLTELQNNEANRHYLNKNL